MKFSAVALLPLLAASASAAGDSLRNPPAPDAAAGARQLGDGDEEVDPSHWGGYYPKPPPHHPPYHPPPHKKHHKKHPKHDDDGVKKIFATKALTFGDTKQILKVGPFTVEAQCLEEGFPQRHLTSEEKASQGERELFDSYELSLNLKISGGSSGYRRLTGDWHKHPAPIAVFGQGSKFGSGAFFEEIDHDGYHPVDPIWSLSGGPYDATGNDDGTGAAYTSNGDYLGWSGEECIGRFVTESAEDFEDFQAFAGKKETDEINCVVACVFKYKEGGQPKKKHAW